MLVLKQVQGHWSMNSPDLKLVHQLIQGHLQASLRFTFRHTLRERNKAADQLANWAMDGRSNCPQLEKGSHPEKLRNLRTLVLADQEEPERSRPARPHQAPRSVRERIPRKYYKHCWQTVLQPAYMRNTIISFVEFN